MDDATRAYYAENAESFSQSRLSIDLSEDYLSFLAEIPRCGHILDVGCGHGRDSRAFCKRGYRVTALDGSKELVSIARKITGLPVQHRTFDAIDEIELYDGIWANASLLHLPKSETIATLPRLKQALKKGGVLWISVREGTGTYRDEAGRFFNDYEEDELISLIEACPGLTLVSSATRPDRRGRPHLWLQLLVRRSADT